MKLHKSRDSVSLIHSYHQYLAPSLEPEQHTKPEQRFFLSEGRKEGRKGERKGGKNGRNSEVCLSDLLLLRA